jgi:hypothetical protein
LGHNQHDEMTEQTALGTNRRDIAAALARSAAGAMPIVGSLVAEIVDSVIPGQKLDRVIGFLEVLAERVGHMEEKQVVLEQRLRTPEGSDLLEEGIVQASRAVSYERRRRIANLVANGVSEEQLQYDRTKKLLAILEALNDSELILLTYYSQPVTIGSPWHHQLQEQYPVLLRPISREARAGEAERQRGAFRDSYERTLIGHGLLERDQAGLGITALGRLLLRSTNDDQTNANPPAP